MGAGDGVPLATGIGVEEGEEGFEEERVVVIFAHPVHEAAAVISTENEVLRDISDRFGEGEESPR